MKESDIIPGEVTRESTGNLICGLCMLAHGAYCIDFQYGTQRYVVDRTGMHTAVEPIERCDYYQEFSNRGKTRTG